MFIFLPLVLGLYVVTPKKFRKYVILLSNIAFYILANISNLTSVAFLCFILIFTLFGIVVLKRVKADNIRNATVIVLFLCAVLLMIFYTTRALTNSGLGILNIVYPLGASIYILSAISLLVDIKRGDVENPDNYINFIIYLSFFPIMIAGPVIKYKNFEKYIDSPQFNINNFARGAKLFAIGFIKRIAIAAVIYEAYVNILATINGQIDLPFAILLLLILALAFYFTLSGYSDMGCGISNMFGIVQKRDFANTYAATSLIEYMSYFFVSMLEWLQDYIIDPLMSIGNNRLMRGKKFIAGLIISCFLTLWYRTDLSLLLIVSPIILIVAFESCFKSEIVKKRKLIFCIFSGIATIFLTSFYWMSIKLADINLIYNYYKYTFTHISTPVPYYAYREITNFKYVIIFIIAINMLLASTKGSIFNLEYQCKSKIVLTLRYISTILLMIIFFVTIYYFMPQYPEYAAKAYNILNI